MRNVYLDYSATTPVKDEVLKEMLPYFTEKFGNPSSLYDTGLEAKAAVAHAREQVAALINADPKEVFFTAGGTEADNWALFGVCDQLKAKGNHIITTKIEHHAILHSCAFLEKQGIDVTYVGIDKDGRVNLKELEDAITDKTILISVMMVNNEIGAVEPIEEAIKVIKEKNPNTLVHVDAIQAYGKYRIFPKKLGIDMLSVSGHKIHAPKGTGFLFIKDKTKVKPLIYGGGQQKGMRSGTENVPGVAALGEASEEIYENFEEKIDHLYQIKQRFVEGVLKIEGVSVNGKTGRDSAPQIVSVSIDGVRSEVMLHTLEDRKIYVSAGSACSSNKPSVSHTLTSIGLKNNLLDSTIRFSFSVHTTEEEIDYALEVMNEVVPKLRRYTRK